MKYIYILVCLNFSLISFSQTCDCESEFNWIKTTFEQNDAGYEYGISLKGKEAYTVHNQNMIQNSKLITDFDECKYLMQDWLLFFRKGHHGIELTQNTTPNNSQRATEKEIIESYKDSEIISISKTDFDSYLTGIDSSTFEAIWVAEPYEIGVIKIKDYYIGFIIKADNVYWSPGQVKFKIHIDSKKATYFMKDHTPQVFDKAKLLGDHYLEMGDITFKRKHTPS